MLGVTALILAFAKPTPAVPVTARNPLPAVMLWAWERPEDLRSLEPGVGVAFLAQSVTVVPDGIRVMPRRQPLKVADSAVLVAVTRIEFPTTRLIEPREVEDLASAVAETSRYPRVRGIQIDFDALESQRPFYRSLIARVRAHLDSRVPLSITALASWCVGDPWLEDLPIDEAVPMVFELGPLNEPYRDVARSIRASRPECRGALGLSLNEPAPVSARGRRIYVFSHRSWTAASIDQAWRLAKGQGGSS